MMKRRLSVCRILKVSAARERNLRTSHQPSWGHGRNRNWRHPASSAWPRTPTSPGEDPWLRLGGGGGEEEERREDVPSLRSFPSTTSAAPPTLHLPPSPVPFVGTSLVPWLVGVVELVDRGWNVLDTFTLNSLPFLRLACRRTFPCTFNTMVCKHLSSLHDSRRRSIHKFRGK